MDISVDAVTEQIDALEHKPRNARAKEEAQHLHDLVESNERLAAGLAEYGEPRVEGVGGSGIVLSAEYKPFGVRRAIKFPRKRTFDDAHANSDEIPLIDPELDALSKVSHEHITRLYDAIRIGETAIYCAITEYVTDPQSLDDYAVALVCADDCRRDEHRRAVAMKQLAGLLYDLANGLLYMHTQASLIHFDIKPLNLLVSSSGKAYITDLGFARDTRKYSPADQVEVGFTWKYAHKVLIDPHHGARVSQTAPKSKNILLGAQITPLVDLFAFGRTIQEVLFRIKRVYGSGINSDYSYNFVHVLAALCLDGKNSNDDTDETAWSFVSDRALGMPKALFVKHKYESFIDVRDALQRLLGYVRLEDLVPELDPWSPATINVSDLGITTLTPRVQALISHPAVERLSGEMQLGMLDTVFPTATHTRLQHCLGTLHAVREYITALYYDYENPTYRVLFSPTAASRALAASILHDLGHTNFGHDLEEVDKKEFSHTEIGELVARSFKLRDSAGRTLADILSDHSPSGWGLSLDSVLAYLGGKAEQPAEYVLLDILDGQLDADKLDYLIRDSVEARVQYGRGIDYQRFLRSLTTVAEDADDDSRLRLAIKRKGAASAEAFAFARYQLYQSLYWHHTFRAIKGMLLTAAAESIAKLRAKYPAELLLPRPLREAYLKHVIGVVTPEQEAAEREIEKRRRQKVRPQPTLAEAIDDLCVQPTPQFRGRYAADRTLMFLWRISDDKARRLVEDLGNRRYYKRVLEVPLGDLSEAEWYDLRSEFDGDKRIALQRKVAKEIYNALNRAAQDQITSRESLVRDEVLERIAALQTDRHGFVCDVPLRGWTASGEEPYFVSDYRRRHFRAAVGRLRPERGGTLWTDVGGMMRRSASFRVFCDPELHHIITRIVDTPEVFKAVKAAVPQLSRLRPE
jgi:HD superfamily phosphohydrolase